MKTDFLGLNLKSPIIIAAGPWNRNGESIRKGLEAGAGAAVTETILSDARADIRPRLAYDGNGVQNLRLYSDIQVEGWEKEIAIAKKGGGAVITSISGHTPSELAYLAKKMESFGADGIEVSLSSPMGEELEIVAASAETMFSMVKAVSEVVNIPVVAKLSQTTTNVARVAKAVKQGGGDAVSAINTIRGILGVDIEKMETTLPAYGGYSGAPIRPIALATVATLAQTVDIPICGIGGVETYHHALEYIMLGASAVQVGTGVLLKGFGIIKEIVSDLEAWEKANGIKSYDEIRGKALDSLKSVGEIRVKPVLSRIDYEKNCVDCMKCISACVYEAIVKKDGDITVVDEKCNGCGMCTFICQQERYALKW